MRSALSSLIGMALSASDLRPDFRPRNHEAGRYVFGRNARNINGVMTQIGVSKYMPHIGAKERARHAGRTTLGPNASRALRDGLTNRDIKILREINDRDLAVLDIEMRMDRDVSLAGIDQQTEQRISRSDMIGSTATWTSSNLQKTGEIVAVVPAGEHPSTDLTPKVKEPGAPRDHDSYVVKANGKHYWPRVSLLSIA